MNKFLNQIKPKLKIGIGAALILLAVIGQNLPFHRGLTVSGVSRLCNSSFGQLGQSFSASARSNCQQANLADDLLWVVIIIGLVLAALGAYQIAKAKAV